MSEAPARLRAEILAELPSLLYRLRTDRGSELIGHPAGTAERNWIRLVPGDRVEVELSPRDPGRGRILRKLVREAEKL